MEYVVALMAVVVIGLIIFIIVSVLTGPGKNKQNTEWKYKATKEYYNFCIDQNAKVWWNKNTLGTPQVHKYGDILDFELVVDDKTTKGKNAIGRAIAGGLLFGGAGAVVGAGTAKRVNVVKSLYINVYLKGGGFEKLIFIQGGFKPDGFVYNVAIDSAHRVISILTEITSGDTAEASAAMSEVDNAEAIAKYKKLLDEGAITQEEYEAKKKQLLNL